MVSNQTSGWSPLGLHPEHFNSMKKEELQDIYQIAAYVIWYSKVYKSPITLLRLQCLLYYIEAYYLAIYEKSLAGVTFEAWPKGPFCREILTFSQVLHESVAINKPTLSNYVENHIEDVLNIYFDMTTTDLAGMVKVEQPWILARRSLKDGCPSGNIISRESMMDYYKDFLDESKNK